LLTGMTGISLHMQWPLTSQSHGSVSQREQLVFCYGSNSTPSQQTSFNILPRRGTKECGIGGICTVAKCQKTTEPLSEVPSRPPTPKCNVANYLGDTEDGFYRLIADSKRWPRWPYWAIFRHLGNFYCGHLWQTFVSSFFFFGFFLTEDRVSQISQKTGWCFCKNICSSWWWNLCMV
jgi:hypothetical protein